MRVLLLEDDPILGDGIRVGLSQEGYTVDWLMNGRDASAALCAEPFDLLVLDLNLPHKSGLDVLRELRSRGNAIPVLVLTARDSISDRVKGLDTGADDYVTKPFDLDELSARARALLRRSKGRSQPQIVRGDLVVDPVAHTVSNAGTNVEVSSGEFTVLQLLLEEQGRVVSRSRLEQAMYGWNKDIDSNTVEVFVHHLRKKLGAALIRTVRGVGYVIDKTR